VNNKMMRERLLASSMLCGAALLALSAQPAAAQGQAGSAVAVEELVVTGSRIPQPNLTSISPVDSVTAQEVQLGGRPQTIDILNQMPQVTVNPGVDLGPTSDPLSGPGGVATVDLRGLGPQRTLVLIDGRRLGLGDPNTGNPNPAPDINQIPSQLIERVDVLTGGASAVYGSDAVGGVVNFIMKKNFEGVQIDAQYGVYQHSNHNGVIPGLIRAGNDPSNLPMPSKRAWDGRSADYSLLMGANAPDGKGNVTAFFTYSKQEPVRQGSRDFSACQFATTAAGRLSCAGSSNSNIFYFANGDSLGIDAAGNPVPVNSDTAIGAGGVLGNRFIDWGSATTHPPSIFNSNPYMYLIQDNTRYTAGYFANYDVNDHFQLYSSFNFMQSQSNVNIAPSALFQGDGVTPGGGFLVNCNNPFLSAQQRTALTCSAGDVSSGATRELLIGRRNVEGGPRNSFYDHTNYRFVFGSKGKLGSAWNYDIYGSFYRTTLSSRVENYLSKSKIQDALLVGGTAANPFCLSGNSGCVPYNIFNEGGVTGAQASSLVILGTQTGTTTERIVEANVTGNLGEYGIQSPWAKDGVRVALGVTQRRDHLQFSPDAAFESNDLSGAGGASVRVNNSLRAAEAYGEIRAPLISDRPFVQDLILEAGYRYSDYSTGIQAKTYKVGFQWQPVDDIRFRGSYNKAIRAPNILELYTQISVTNTSDVPEDPCAANAEAPATAAQCARTGVSAAQYGNIPQCPANQCAVQTGGNPDLQPETAKTFTVGFTTRPRFLPGFTASVDYYRIKITNIIGTIPLDIILNRCLTTGEQQFCSQVIRNPSSGILFGTTTGAGGYINGTNVNVAASRTEGFDIQAGYNLPLSDWGVDNWGKVSFDLTGSLLTKSSNVPLPGDPSYDCAGYYGETCATANPKWRHTARVNWTTPWTDATISLAWRYWGKTKYENLSTDTGLAGRPNGFVNKIKAENYFDLSGIWRVNDMFSVRGGVNNIFDNDPPLLPAAVVGGGLPNTYPFYDLLGRRFFMGVTANF
jgi:outer membrane receptor protein involved in Fe transport